MNKKLEIGSKVYIKVLLPFALSKTINYDKLYTVIAIDYFKAYPITIYTNHSFIYLTLDNIMLA